MYRETVPGLSVLGAAALAVAIFHVSLSEATADEVATDASAEARRLIEETGGVEGGVVDALVNQTPEEALSQDLELVAAAKGWTYEDAQAQYIAAEEVGAIAEIVARNRPEVFVGSALSEEPGGAPTLYIKGPADDFIREFVTSSGVDVVVADNQPYSFDELEARKLRVHHALEAMGFRYVTTSVNIQGRGVVPAGVTIEPGLPRSAADIIEYLPADLRGMVQLTVHSKPNVADHAAFGGMQLRDDGANECTSGWSVRSLTTGVLGVSGAGHCTGINQVVHPGHGVHPLTFQREHRGPWGDAEWYSSAQPEPDDFYASATDIRDVSSIEPRASISVNESVCQYGRASNDRDCSLDVQDVSQACTNSGVFNDRLVLMDGETTIPGDSGGGWSLGNRAYGSQKGRCNPNFPDNDAWSVADLYDEAIGVRVTCGC